MNVYVDRFLDLLARATAAVTNPYFSLPIDGQDLPVYRERVYAYELYHQLRSIWPDDWDFVLNGEVDKQAHPLIHGDHLQDRKPDLLVHRPGDMTGNLVILEIKPVSATADDIAADLRKLTAFCRSARYRLGILLFFGQQSSGLLPIQQKSRRALNIAGDEADSTCIAIFWQPEAARPAVPVAWDSAA